MNNLWGKFAQNNDRLNTRICKNYTELAEVLYSTEYQVESIHMTSRKAVVDYKKTNEQQKIGRYTNIPIAAFTTAYARLKLYDLLDMLKERVVYADTDSVIFTTNNTLGELKPPVGVFLGDLTDEVSDGFGLGAKGVSFVSTGPKTYCLDVLKINGERDSIVRCKGFSVNEENKHLICSDFMKKLVPSELTSVETLNTQFRPGKYGGVSLKTGTKSLRNTYRKRMITSNITYETAPWGSK